ncbi:MAG: hypothetical protein LKJ75_01155 [Clostridia bacterium]|jgi:outer membrane lipoprotein-sorting protein|nr:hypothetical protein [Clostridia bacterium]MCI2013795.1 hypothetical protein [Clostridia bacterium]
MGFRKILLFLLVPMLFVGCGQKEKTPMEKIQVRLGSIKSYECSATLTRISNKSSNTYGTKQYYKNTGQYRLELTSPDDVAGNYTVFDGKTVCQYNPHCQKKIIRNVPQNQARNELFLGSFFKNYLNSEDVAIDTVSIDESACTVLEANMPGGNKNMVTEKLWINDTTLKPVKLVIYDKDKKERYILEYGNFEYDVQLSNDIFTIKE